MIDNFVDGVYKVDAVSVKKVFVSDEKKSYTKFEIFLVPENSDVYEDINRTYLCTGRWTLSSVSLCYNEKQINDFLNLFKCEYLSEEEQKNIPQNIGIDELIEHFNILLQNKSHFLNANLTVKNYNGVLYYSVKNLISERTYLERKNNRNFRRRF